VGEISGVGFIELGMSGSAFWTFIAALIIFAMLVLQVKIDRGKETHKTRWLRLGLIFVGALGVVVAFLQARQSSKELNKSGTQIQDLTQSVNLQKQTNDTDYRRSQQQLQQLSHQLQELQTQVTTQELQKKITSLQNKLNAALAPKPTANLIAGFFLPDNTGPPTDETTVALIGDSVTLGLWLYNPTDVVAKNGSIAIKICPACTYTKEPDGFAKVPGAEKEREFDFPRLYARSYLRKLTVEVMPPPNVGAFEIGIAADCETCTPQRFKILKVNVLR